MRRNAWRRRFWPDANASLMFFLWHLSFPCANRAQPVLGSPRTSPLKEEVSRLRGVLWKVRSRSPVWLSGLRAYPHEHVLFPRVQTLLLAYSGPFLHVYPHLRVPPSPFPACLLRSPSSEFLG